MKVLFFISILSHGRGGHVHSLDHISREIGKNELINIVSVGPGRSEILESSPYFLKHIKFNGWDILKVRKEVKTILKTESPDVIHCFDERVYDLLKMITHNKSYKFVLNKCGGPNPTSYPQAENLVLFSKENESWFNNSHKFDKTLKYLIPNRVSRIQTVSQHPFKKDDTLFTFVRIARISRFHSHSISVSISLVKKLMAEGIENIRLLIIGTIQEEKAYEELKEMAKNMPIQFIVDDKYTSDASKLLYLADAVIGTGRGAMEASSLSLPVLSPTSNSPIPVVLTKENIDEFFKYNFSPRSVASHDDLLNNWDLILEVIKKDEVWRNTGGYMASFFDTNFNIEFCYEKYKDVYCTAISNQYNVPAFSDLKLRIKTLYAFFINRKNYNLNNKLQKR